MSTHNILINKIPDHIRLPDSINRIFDIKVSLAGWLTELDRIADGGVSNGVFTADCFNYFSKKDNALLKKIYPEAMVLKGFRTFGDFKKYVEQYIASKRCDDPVIKKQEEKGDARWFCLAPPEPTFPIMPKRPKKPLKQRPAIKNPRTDLSAFSSDYPKWFDEEEPKVLSDHNKPPTGEPIQQLKELALTQLKSAVEAIGDNIPSFGNQGFYTYFDGKNFIFDIHGCIVNAQDEEWPCIADAPFHLVRLKNLDSSKRVSRRSDIKGYTRVKVPAKVGDTIKVYNLNEEGESRWLTNLYFRIHADGKIEGWKELSSEYFRLKRIGKIKAPKTLRSRYYSYNTKGEVK